MKLLIAFPFLVTMMILQGSDLAQVRSDLKAIKTEKQARAYLKRTGLQGNIMMLDQIQDSSATALKLFAAKGDEVIEQSNYLYKALTTTEAAADRVQYIFFDGSKVKKSDIDSRRSKILKRLKAGDTFHVLAKEYSMDANGKLGGDLGWYDRATMVNEFVAAVNAHKKGDVFSVDVPSRQWYYVVRKTHDPIKRKKITAFYIAAPSK